MKMHTVKVKDIPFNNNNPLVLIAGPCVIESKELVLRVAKYIKDITEELGVGFIFKTSYDKANRSSIRSYRGPGLEKGLEIIKEVKDKLNVPVLLDIHSKEEASVVAEVADVLQIPAFLCRQTDIVVSAAKTGKPINVKKGQFLSPYEVKNIIEKIKSVKNNKILLTERGTCFGYNNLVVDMRSLVIMKGTGYPVIFDATHSLQLPGGGTNNTYSGGQPEFIPYLSAAAVAIGIAGLFIETHPKPQKALSDGANMLPLGKLKSLLKNLVKIDKVVKGYR
jgi:2-dehydro-3-deoxyphosphooctonate aldolase (KDO 8-P synthase)